jgi:hypothetical protein
MIRWVPILSLSGVIPLSSVTFGRKYRVLIAGNTANKEGKITAIDVSQLRVTFEIEKTYRSRANYAYIAIYNLWESTESDLVKNGSRVIVEAGYDNGIYGTIFDGDIIQFIREKENNLDYVLTLVCLDGDSFLNHNLIKLTLNAGQNKRQIIDAICKRALVSTEISRISPDISNERLPRGKVLFGDPKQYLEDVTKEQNGTFYMENGKAFITKYSDEPPTTALVVSPSTGLIGVPEQTQDGANFKLLLDPRINLLSMIKIDNSTIRQLRQEPERYPIPLDNDGQYQVYRMRHVGDSRGNDWYTEIEGFSRYAKNILLFLASADQNPN